jgi:hypothetical protein
MECTVFMRRQIYEGDSLIHAAPGRDHAEAGSSTDATSPEATREVATRRSEALRGFFPKLSVWISNRIHFSRMREVESYLSQATDLADLEHRIAKIERGTHWH